MKFPQRLFLSLFAGVLLGAVVSALSAGDFWRGWLVYSLVLWVSLFFLLSAWQWAGGGKTLAWMMVLAFLLRVGVGIALNYGLPIFGYVNEVQHNGYLFRDAFERDVAAWNLAKSDQTIWISFRNEIKVDQYGGLLSLSAAVYRFLSPDAHRPYLVLILGAFFTALGLPFFISGIEKRWNRKLANLSGWILVLYPDSILFGSSQMREPFLLGFSAIAFWAVLTWSENRKTRLLAFLGCAVGMFLISSRIAIAILGFLLVWFLIEQVLPHFRGPRWVLWAVVLLGVATVGILSYGWFLSSAGLDLKLTEMGSGWMQKIIAEAGETFRIPIIVTYGLAQPVLPAAIAEPTLWIWRVIMLPRAIGWYALAPLLIYGVFTVLKTKKRQDKSIFLWVAGFLILWLLLSSARAGGDAWDNPRYRASFLPWMALFAAWAVLQAVEKKDAWLARWLLVEIIFLGFFTNWYFSRYYLWWPRLPFWQMVAWIIGLSVLVLSSGWMAGQLKRIRGSKRD